MMFLWVIFCNKLSIDWDIICSFIFFGYGVTCKIKFNCKMSSEDASGGKGVTEATASKGNCTNWDDLPEDYYDLLNISRAADAVNKTLFLFFTSFLLCKTSRVKFEEDIFNNVRKSTYHQDVTKNPFVQVQSTTQINMSQLSVKRQPMFSIAFLWRFRYAFSNYYLFLQIFNCM